MYLGTQKHVQADWNAKWHLMENVNQLPLTSITHS